jgi:Na+/H+-dicarboxylate symporter
MFDAKSLLDQFIGGQNQGRPTGTGGQGSGDLLQQATQALSGFGGGAVAGGLAGLLLGSKSGRKIAGSALTYGGMAVAGALAYYIALLSLVSAAFVALLYPVAVVGGRVGFRRFARASAAGQAVAFTTRSSLAALPACLEGMRRDLGLPPAIGSFFLPLAASVFRVGGAIAQVVTVLFLARLYGVALDPAQVAMVILTVIPTSFTIPGIPAGAIITMTPVLAAVGLPVEGIGIVLGVDTFSDMFRTMANVTGWMAVGAILGRRRGRDEAIGDG